MSELSISENILKLKLEKSQYSIVKNFLERRIHFKRRQADNLVIHFETRHYDAAIITKIQTFFQNRKFKLVLDSNCQGVLNAAKQEEGNFGTLREEAQEIKDTDDGQLEQIIVPEFADGNELEQYQIKPVLHGLKLRNSANFTVPGGGKTWMAYATYFLAKAETDQQVNKLLVVCPKTAFQVWEEEYTIITKKDFTDVIHRINTEDRDSEKITSKAQNFEILLINYEILESCLEQLKEVFQNENYNFYFIIDESHKIKNPDSNRGGASLELSPFAKRRMILTGTPMPAHHPGLWNQFTFLFPRRRVLGSYEGYMSRIGKNDRPNLVERRRVNEELNPFFTRVTETQLDLEEPAEFEIACPMTKFQTEIYETIAWAILQNDENREKFEAYRDYEQNMMYLIMASTDPALLAQDNQYNQQLKNLEDVAVVDRIKQYGEGETSGKILVLRELLKTIIPKKEKIIIWCNFRNNLTKIEKMIRKEFHCEVRKIDGSVDLDDNANPLENKEKSLREFKTCDDVNILIANPASLAESVSLHKVCHHAIYVDRTYVATNWVQSKKRIHRIGMERGIETRYTVLKSVYPHLDDDTEDPRRTIDHDLDDNLQDKVDAMNEFLIDPGLNEDQVDLVYDRINNTETIHEDYRQLIEFLKRQFLKT